MTKLYKFMFFNFLIFGIFITISANSWLGVWLGLEINLLSFIPLMSDFKNLMTNEASMKYFITQVLASLILLISFISFNYQNNWETLMSIALFLKMGAAPLHTWLPPVMEGLSWGNILILGTLQKIAPMIVISYNVKEIFLIFLICSVIMGSILSMNQTSMKKIMAYSAINHSGWMISAILFSKFIWLTYFSVYSLMLSNIVWLMKILNMNHIKQTMFSMKTTMKLNLAFNFWNLAGIPPFLGFWPKWLVIQTLIENQWFIITFTMIGFTLLMIFTYTRLLVNSLMMKSFEINFWMKTNFNYKNLILNFFTLSSILLNTSILFLL